VTVEELRGILSLRPAEARLDGFRNAANALLKSSPYMTVAAARSSPGSSKSFSRGGAERLSEGAEKEDPKSADR
jgi:hypothetical protein